MVGEMSRNDPLAFKVSCLAFSLITMNGTGLVVWAVWGRRWRIDHHFGVAVVGGDQHGAALSLHSFFDFARQVSTVSTALIVGSILPE